MLHHLKVHYCHHNSLPLVSVMSLIKPAHTLIAYFCMVQINNILQSMPRSYKWFHSFWFSYHNPECMSLLPHMYYAPRLI